MALDDLISAWEDAFPVYVDGGIASSGPARPNKKKVNKLGQVIADAIAENEGGGGGGDVSALTVRVNALEAIDSEDRLEALESAEDIFPAYRREMLERPGDAPELFADTYAGSPDAIAQTTLTPTNVVSGNVLQVSGAHVLARRGMVRIEPNRKYLVRAIAQRVTDPADPLGDAVELGMAWFTNAMAPVSATPTSVLGTFAALTVVSGRTQKQAIVALASGDDITNVAPATTVYARPYARSYGSGGLTNIEVLEVKDVTDSIGDAIAESLVNDAIAAAATVQTIETSVESLRDDAVAAAASAGGDLWTRSVDSIESTEPGSPSVGDRILLDDTNATHPNQIAEYFSGGWHYSGTPRGGQTVADLSSGIIYRFGNNSGEWFALSGKLSLAPDIATLDSACDAADVGWDIDDDVTLGASVTCVAPVGWRRGKITLGTHNLVFNGGFRAPSNAEVFDASSTGVVTIANPGKISARWFGAKFDGTTNDLASHLSANACALASGGGTIELLSGTTCIGGALAYSNGVNVWGQGGNFSITTNAATRFKCTASGSQVSWGGRGTSNVSYGGKSGNFVVDGNSVATNPFYLGRCVSRSFESIFVRASVADAIWLEETQNCIFENVNTDAAGAWGITFDRGAAGNRFYSHENNAAVGGGIRFMNQTSGSGITAYTLNNQFYGCIIERCSSGKVIYHDYGEDNCFFGLNASVLSSGVASAANMIELTANHSFRFRLVAPTGMTGDVTYSTCFKLANTAELKLISPGKINNFLNVWDLDTGSSTDIMGLPAYGTNTNMFKAAMTGTVNTVMRHQQQGPVGLTTPTTSEDFLIGVVKGDAGQRMRMSRSGEGFSVDGTTSNPTAGNSAFSKGTVTIASGSTSQTVAHALGSTPSRFIAVPTNNPTNDPGHVWITADGTNVTVHCRSDPGSSGLIFRWESYL